MCLAVARFSTGDAGGPVEAFRPGSGQVHGPARVPPSNPLLPPRRRRPPLPRTKGPAGHIGPRGRLRTVSGGGGGGDRNLKWRPRRCRRLGVGSGAGRGAGGLAAVAGTGSGSAGVHGGRRGPGRTFLRRLRLLCCVSSIRNARPLCCVSSINAFHILGGSRSFRRRRRSRRGAHIPAPPAAPVPIPTPSESAGRGAVLGHDGNRAECRAAGSLDSDTARSVDSASEECRRRCKAFWHCSARDDDGAAGNAEMAARGTRTRLVRGRI